MTTPLNHHDPRPAAGNDQAPGSLRCPECGETARLVPPTAWPLAGFAARPAASHADGTPLCPVYGPDGECPAEPVGVPARLTLGQAVRQSWLVHPDWTVEDHLAWLDGEGYDAPDGEDPAALVGRWLAEHRATTTPGTASGVSASETRLYVVAGGDMVAVFDDPAAAGVQKGVMEAAGLDAVGWAVTASHWDQARTVLATECPWITVTDVRQWRTGPTA
jgi:hypothetical protein